MSRPIRLLAQRSALPIWRRSALRALEIRWQAQSTAALMDLAGLASAQLALALAPHARTVCILAGPGNNGGDGLEAGAWLHRWGRRVHVYLLAEAQRLPADAQRALARAQAAGVLIEHGLPDHSVRPGQLDLCVDALLGMGLTRAPQGELLQAIQWLNACAAPVLSLDVPSGLDADSGQALGGDSAVVQAAHTLTLLGAKPGLLMGQGRDACGTLWLSTLGLPAEATEWVAPDARLNAPDLPWGPAHASHKGSHGDLAVVGGETLGPRTGMAGAAVLAAQAALHGGAGRVMLCLLGNEMASGLNPPADLMRRDLDALNLPRLTVVAGCGGGQAIAAPLGRLLQYSARLVLDADALNRIAENTWLQDSLRQRAARGQDTVLTPHPLEAARLLGLSTAQVQADRLGAATEIALRWQCAVVLKGSGTVMAMPGQTPCINGSGNGWLAVGGTGDVLAGLIGARWARGASAWQAACGAVWTHGHMADTWSADQALTASALAQRLR